MYPVIRSTHRSTNNHKKYFAVWLQFLFLQSQKQFFISKRISSFGRAPVATNAKVAHLVEHDLAKVGVAGSSPVFRSKSKPCVWIFFVPTFYKVGWCLTRVVVLVDTQDLKSCSQQCECGFNSHPGYWLTLRCEGFRWEAFFIF